MFSAWLDPALKVEAGLDECRPSVDNEYAAPSRGVLDVLSGPGSVRYRWYQDEPGPEQKNVTEKHTSDRSAPRSGKPSICFVALKAYGLLSGREDIQHIGGAEVQQVNIARELARRGLRVSFVVLDHGQPECEHIDGIEVYKAYKPDAGLRFVRFIVPRTTGLWRTLKRANSDVYYQRGAGEETGLVANWCRRHGRAFILAIAHDTNCQRKPPVLTTNRERLLYTYGLLRADVIVAQTESQQQMLRSNVGLESILVRSCCELAEWSSMESQPPPNGHTRVLWAGRLSPEKRPEWAVRMAEELSDVSFDFVGQCNTDSAYGRELSGHLKALPNVTWHQFVPHAEMHLLYRSARVLLCTSESEGFPNVFLESWACGRPVLTTVDPDHLVTRHQLGRVHGEYEAQRDCLAQLGREKVAWEKLGENALRYVSAHHSVDASADAMEHVCAQAADIGCRVCGR